MLAAYTLGHAVEMQHFYVDEAADYTIAFDRKELDDCVQYAAESRRATGVRGLVARALAGEVDAAGSTVVVFGATEPWLECMLLAAGAAAVTTVDYKTVAYDHPKLPRQLNVSAFEAATRPGAPLAASFDLALALSAFDHDGLGRCARRAFATREASPRKPRSQRARDTRARRLALPPHRCAASRLAALTHVARTCAQTATGSIPTATCMRCGRLGVRCGWVGNCS
jgi:hypothetical protein